MRPVNNQTNECFTEDDREPLKNNLSQRENKMTDKGNNQIRVLEDEETQTKPSKARESTRMCVYIGLSLLFLFFFFKIAPKNITHTDNKRMLTITEHK